MCRIKVWKVSHRLSNEQLNDFGMKGKTVRPLMTENAATPFTSAKLSESKCQYMFVIIIAIRQSQKMYQQDIFGYNSAHPYVAMLGLYWQALRLFYCYHANLFETLLYQPINFLPCHIVQHHHV
jgi:hypothetical protein